MQRQSRCSCCAVAPKSYGATDGLCDDCRKVDRDEEAKERGADVLPDGTLRLDRVRLYRQWRAERKGSR